MHRLDLARKLGARWPNAILPFTHRATKRYLISCQCGARWYILPERGELTNEAMYNIESLFSCDCIPPLRECVSPEELKELLMGLPLDALNELVALLPPEKESPRRGSELDEGRVVQGQFKDSARTSSQQSRILPEGNELACALHADCAGHEPPTGDAA